MDCIIPSHSVRCFCAAIGCLSRIGKDLYVDFDELGSGLTMRALNDAKSAFGSFRFAPSFFERCSTSDDLLLSSNRNKNKKRNHAATAATPDSQDSDAHYSCRIPLRAMSAIVRPRRGVLSLRVYTTDSGENETLSFEFLMPSRWRVVHRVAVAAKTEGVSAVFDSTDCSELVASPKVLLRMLEPVQKQRTAEVALILNDKYKVMTATSFHHGDVAAQSSNNALMHASTTATLLKTETSIGCDELEEFDFRDDREDDKEMPETVNEEVVLVFGAKEMKAMLQFCAHAHLDEELRVAISFHWGGKPMVVETEQGTSFSGQLVMATLDHKLLEGFRASSEVPERSNRSHAQQ